MKNKKNIVFLILSSFWFLSLLFIAPVSAEVSHASGTQTLSAGKLENSGIEYLSNFLPWEKDSVQIDVFYDGKEIVLPSGRLDLIYKSPGTRLKAGRIPLTLQINVDGKFQKRVRLTSRVLVTQKVIKINRAFRRGEIILQEDVSTETIETEKPWENVISKIDKAVGFQVKRNLPNGRILTSRNIKAPALGVKGDKILILAQKGGMKITTPGILKEDGYEDSMVQVLNMQTKKMIYGRLIDANTVKVSF
jgi:flagellar basal body P-ring formation protein FlgA